MQLENLRAKPKRETKRSKDRAALYPYYAGFRAEFAKEILKSAPKHAVVLDPWNGAGTTTTAAAALGQIFQGFDLNPVMVIVAKARLLPSGELGSIEPLAESIVNDLIPFDRLQDQDPLNIWLTSESAAIVRAIESRLQSLLVTHGAYRPLLAGREIERLSYMAAFFYLALFRVLREALRGFVPKNNPTWIKRPREKSQRVRFRAGDLAEKFKRTVNEMMDLVKNDSAQLNSPTGTIRIANSQNLPIESDSVDLVLTSPPYCTRLDYAVATSPELALLGIGGNSEFLKLRRDLIGTATVPKSISRSTGNLGESCLKFLEEVRNHESKDSATYYYKNHLQYFLSMRDSLKEIGRALRKEGKCLIVVQDSYYKNIHNDLARSIVEIAEGVGLSVRSQRSFPTIRSVSDIHPTSHHYRSRRADLTESVIEFEANLASNF